MNPEPNIPLIILIMAAMFIVADTAIRKEESLLRALLRALRGQ